MDPLSVFLVSPPGLEPQLLQEAREIGLPGPKPASGGVECDGGWEAVRRANLRSRIASRVLARVASFRAVGFPALVAGFREVDWASVLPEQVGLRVEGHATRSRAAHGGAVARHLGEALDRAGLSVSRDGTLRIVARVERDHCTVSVDTSGEPLHKRGHKLRVNRAPLRETLAAGFLRAAGYEGKGAVLDPMCGSGTVPIEAAEIAMGLRPGRSRGFAFEMLPSHDPSRWDALRREIAADASGSFHGSDRDAGAVAMSVKNAARAGVADVCAFRQGAVSDLSPPEGLPGLVLVNPPYGARLGQAAPFALYAAFGRRMRTRFAGWRVGLITSQDALAQACDLPWEAPGPHVDHGGVKVRLRQAQL